MTVVAIDGGSPEIRAAPHAPFGATVTGVDLRHPLGEDCAAEIRALLAEHLVLFFRDQHLTDEEHVALAQTFGPLLPHPITTLRGERGAVTVVRNDAVRKPTNAAWHSDLSWLEQPPAFAILRAIQIPERGGDTLWANMHAAWDGLPEPLRERVADLRAVHDFDRAVGPKLRRLDGNAGHRRLRAALPPAEHPLARRHPTTGRPALFVNESFTSHIVGVSPRESGQILDALFAHIRLPMGQLRHAWREGDVVVWDERFTQHFATSDHYPAEREVRRVTIAAEKPT